MFVVQGTLTQFNIIFTFKKKCFSNYVLQTRCSAFERKIL